MGVGQFIAVTGGSVGGHPLDPRTWSGLSHSFFLELQRRGRLYHAFTAEPRPWKKLLSMLKTIHPDRKRWRKQFYMDTGYRDALTDAVRRHVRAADLDCSFVQVGAMFNLAEALQGKATCYSYSDSSVAESIRSPYAPRNLSVKRIDRAIAYEKRVYGSMTKVFTCGEYLRTSMIKDFGLPPDRVVAIGAAAVLQELPNPFPGKVYDTREVLFLGADFRRKGGAGLLQAFEIVRGRIPDARLHVVGPEGLRVPPALEGGVIHHGFLDKKKPEEWLKLQSLFRRCSLFVLPSLYEPFGVAPLEAMTFEIPCVVSSIGALKETVIPGKTGELAEPGNVEDLADKITKLLMEPDVLQRMGRAARQLVLEQYTWPRVVDRFMEATGTAAAIPTPLPLAPSASYQ
jgi:starch synthase